MFKYIIKMCKETWIVDLNEHVGQWVKDHWNT